MNKNKKLFVIILILIVIFVMGISINDMFDLKQKETEKKETNPVFQENERLSSIQVKTSDVTMIQINATSIFNIFGSEDGYEIINEIKIWKNNVVLAQKPENMKLYEELGVHNDNQKSVVIFPVFTAAAYSEPGFYTYYGKECDEKCLTVELKDYYDLTYVVSGIGVQVLTLLGYEIISDIEVDQNPNILEQYDKVILLHNEYVTKRIFDAIINHPKVIYLYPNALYGLIEVDYDSNMITLIRGHGYPESYIDNGFDWEFDNTRPDEFDVECKNWKFNKVTNGIQLNCYPEKIISLDTSLLKIIKDF